jgi:hypothetical protein
VPDPAHQLQRYRALARAFDAQFRFPGTGIRFGWDALLGLVPGIGDVLGSLVGGYGIWVAARLGAPVVVLLRMLLNLVLDVAGGELPVVGDLFDVSWRSNLRNLALLERWYTEPHETRRRSMWFFAGIGLTLLAALAIAIAVAVWLVRSLLLLLH